MSVVVAINTRVSTELEQSKEVAAREACKIFSSFADEVRVLGLGTGTSVKKFIDVCLEFLKLKEIVASSLDTVLYLTRYNVKAIDLLSVGGVDTYIDGADEVSERLDLIKGRGAALLREKTLAYMSNKRIYIVDYTKYNGVDYLYTKHVPIEVIPPALNYVLKIIRGAGLFEPLVRSGGGKDGPIITDNFNFVVDLKPLKPITNAAEAHRALKSIHGVVETGIFPSEDLVDLVIIGYPDRAVVMQRKS